MASPAPTGTTTKRSPAAPRPDLVTYNSLKPGSLLNFVEVKNGVDDDDPIGAP